MPGFNPRKTLQQLEGFDYGKPDRGDTGLVKSCIRLTRVPLEKFTAADLQLMIAQQIGLKFLIPLAIQHLRADPLVEVRFYPGDLLASVLGVDPQFWHRHPDSRVEIVQLTEQATASFPSRSDVARKTTTRTLTRAYREFQNQKLVA